MESLIYTIAKELKISEFLLNIPSFYESFYNWYFYNHHYWEYIPDSPQDQGYKFDESESDFEWHISTDNWKDKEYKVDPNIDDLFDSASIISDTGSDYSLYWYNSD